MANPVRLQLSRRKGFNLQALSRATNGLPAVNVARPSVWGNPFRVHPHLAPGRRLGIECIAVPSIDDAIGCYREMFACEAGAGTRAAWMREHLTDLSGNNLACWCAPGAPCHADVLLEIANAPPPSRSGER